MRSNALNMPSSAAWLLLGLFLFQSAGWLMAWQCMRWNAKVEARNALFQGKNLSEKTFSQSFFTQIKIDKKEIRLNGQLYDFYTVAETKDSIRVALYHDQKEQALISAMGLLFHSGEQSGQSSVPGLAHWLAQSLGVSFLVAPAFELPEFSLLACSKPVCSAYSWGVQFVPGVFAPPPEYGKG